MTNRKSAVVTGAAGFTGYSLTMKLANLGYNVHAIVRPDSEHNKRIKHPLVNIIELDYSAYDELASRINSKCDYFYHLVWCGGRDDFGIQMKNIDYSLVTLEEAHKLGCKRFICTGSQAEYGIQKDIITEDVLPNPINSYGVSKLSAMYLTKRRAEQLGIDWIWGRIFSLYGKYEPSGRLFSDLIKNMLDGKSMDLSSCRQFWDYLNVEDAADALVALAEKGKNGNIYNIANGDYKELKWYVEEMKKITFSRSEILYGDDPEPFISLKPSVDKIMKDTGWKPKIKYNVGVKKQIEFLEKTSSGQ